MQREVPRYVLDVLGAIAAAVRGDHILRDVFSYREEGDRLLAETLHHIEKFPGDPRLLGEAADRFIDSAAGLRYGMRRWWRIGPVFKSLVEEVGADALDDPPSPELLRSLELPAEPQPASRSVVARSPETTQPAAEEGAEMDPGDFPAHARYTLARFIELVEPLVGAPGWCRAMREAALRGDAAGADALWRGLGQDAITPTVDHPMAQLVATACANVAELYRPPRHPRGVVLLFR